MSDEAGVGASGADIKHIADCHCPAQMRQQQLAKLDLALRDDALAFVSADTEEGEMRWCAHQEERHPVDRGGRLYPFLPIRRRFEIRSGKVARGHMWLVQRRAESRALRLMWRGPQRDVLSLFYLVRLKADSSIKKNAILPEIGQA